MRLVVTSPNVTFLALTHAEALSTILDLLVLRCGVPGVLLMELLREGVRLSEDLRTIGE